jgi:Zn-finger nucleic acid-binding protein
MLCPLDQTELKITDRQGIEIDYCPKCRGVWLDRGELDKLIERSAGGASGFVASAPAGYQPHRYGEGGEGGEGGERGHHGKRRHKSFLGDIFDF